jgi:hypothetical protein
MPKATKNPTTPSTRAPACTAASQDAMVRMLAPSFISSDDWSSRTRTNRAMMAVSGAAERLEGLQYICINLSFAEIAKRGPNANINELHSPFHFLSVTLGEYAKALNAAHQLWWDDYNVESKGDVT